MKNKLLGAIGTLLANGALALAQTQPTLGAPAPADTADVPAAVVPADAPAAQAATDHAPADHASAGHGSTAHAPVADLSCSQGGVPRFWASADYLHLWIQDGPVPIPLVTTGPDNVLFSGVPGQPGTVNLFPSDGRLDYGDLSGWRVNVGAWLDDAGCLGIEAGGFGTERGSTSFRLAGDANGQPFFGRPFVNALTGENNIYFVSQNFADPALDANLTGALAIDSTTRIWGWEVSGVTSLCRERYFKSEAIAGFRYIDLDESLRFAEVLRSLGGAGGGFFLGAPVDPSEAIASFDSFQTRSRFYGAQIGARAEWRRGCILLGLAGKMAFGVSHQELTVSGGTARVDAAGNVVATTPGGVYALSSNIGRRSHDDFAVVPEVGVNLGYEVRDGIILRLGYNFLYLSSAARPGQHIDPVINPGLVPSDATFGAAGPDRPHAAIDNTNFYAHGLNLGVELRY
jgi:hypothetical protein